MSDLIDRVAEAMAGWPMDTAPVEDAEAWRANAKAALRVIREHPDLELRDDLTVLFAEKLADLMSADVEIYVSNALALGRRCRMPDLQESARSQVVPLTNPRAIALTALALCALEKGAPQTVTYLRLKGAGLTHRNAFALASAGYDVISASAVEL